MRTVFHLFIILALFAAFTAWSFLGLSGLVVMTVAFARFCHSLLTSCLEYSELMGLGFFWFGGLVLAAGFMYAAIRGTGEALKTRGALKRLPLKDRGGSIVLIDDIASRAAFTHGFLRPRIYISKGLLHSLDRKELLGVFHHELHHRRRFDPLKFFLASFVKDTFFYIPVISYLYAYVRWRCENEADDEVVLRMSEPVSLAGALLKVRRQETAMAPASITGHGAYNTGGVEARIRRLLTGTEAAFTPPKIRAVVSSLAVSLVLALSFTAPLHAGLNVPDRCTADHCSVHADKPGKDCRTHCEAPSHGH